MDSNPVYADQYCANIKSYVIKGYVRKLSLEEAKKGSKKMWYLPLCLFESQQAREVLDRV